MSLLSSNRSTILENRVEEISEIISTKFCWWAKLDLIHQNQKLVKQVRAKRDILRELYSCFEVITTIRYKEQKHCCEHYVSYNSPTDKTLKVSYLCLRYNIARTLSIFAPPTRISPKEANVTTSAIVHGGGIQSSAVYCLINLWINYFWTNRFFFSEWISVCEWILWGNDSMTHKGWWLVATYWRNNVICRRSDWKFDHT